MSNKENKKIKKIIAENSKLKKQSNNKNKKDKNIDQNITNPNITKSFEKTHSIKENLNAKYNNKTQDNISTDDLITKKNINRSQKRRNQNKKTIFNKIVEFFVLLFLIIKKFFKDNYLKIKEKINFYELKKDTFKKEKDVSEDLTEYNTELTIDELKEYEDKQNNKKRRNKIKKSFKFFDFLYKKINKDDPDISKNKTLNIIINFIRYGFIVFLAIFFFQLVSIGSAKELKQPGVAIYDKDGVLVGNAMTSGGTWEDFKNIPVVLKDAVISAEDARFYRHVGFDIPRLIRAIIDAAKGRYSGGASTITQQVTKNAYFFNDKDIIRKIKEIPSSLAITLIKSKNYVLETYFNTILYGSDAYGINDASKYYFDKDTEDLNLLESAYLAGLPKAPNANNIFINEKNANKRKDQILGLIYNQGFMSEFSYNAFKKVNIKDLSSKKHEISFSPNASYIDIVKKQLKEKNIDLEPGMEIYTALDQKAQNTLYEKVYANGFPKDGFELASSIIDNESGNLVASFGGVDYQKGEYNYSYDAKRQPGSTMKPILPYAGAVEELKWGSATLLNDSPISYTNGPSINNHDNKFMGTMSMRKAISYSRNPTSVFTMKKLLSEKGGKVAKKIPNNLGIIFPFDNQIYESYALGAFEGVNVVQAAEAFSAFPNEGKHREALTFTKITNSRGREIKFNRKENQAFSKETAFIISDILRDVVNLGTGTQARINSNIWQGGKTGSTNFPEEVLEKYNWSPKYIKDIWYNGFTSKYTMSTWTGYPSLNSNAYLTTNSYQYSRILHSSVMSELLTGKEVHQKEMPSGLVSKNVCLATNKIIEEGSSCNGQTSKEYFWKDNVNINPNKIGVQSETTNDSQKPVILGANDVTIAKNQRFSVMAGISATDKQDGNLTSKILATPKSIDTNIPGVYKITYSVTDSDGYQTIKVRSVRVVSSQTQDDNKDNEDKSDNTNNKPVFSGSANASVNQGSGIVDPVSLVSLSAIDKEDGNLKITSNTKIDLSKPGSYPVTFSATDSDGNSVFTSGTITVKKRKLFINFYILTKDWWSKYF